MPLKVANTVLSKPGGAKLVHKGVLATFGTIWHRKQIQANTILEILSRTNNNLKLAHPKNQQPSKPTKTFKAATPHIFTKWSTRKFVPEDSF